MEREATCCHRKVKIRAASRLSFAMAEIVHLRSFCGHDSLCEKAEGESCHGLGRQQGGAEIRLWLKSRRSLLARVIRGAVGFI
jgi:hypothetical protein